MKRLIGILFVILLTSVLIFTACSTPGPAPSSSPAPAVKAQAPPPSPASSPASSPAAAPAKILKFAYPMPARGDMGVTMEWWAKEVSSRSGGKVKVETYPQETLMKTAETLDAVLGGVADVAIIDPLVFAKRFMLTTVVTLPTMSYPDTVDGWTAGGDALMAMYKKYPSWQAEYKDLKPVAYPNGIRSYFVISKKEIRTPDDLKGKKIGSTTIGARLVESCGGVPVSIVPPDAYVSLDKGVIDGIFFTWAQVASYKMQEIVSYYLDYGLTGLTLPMIMNLNSWNSLPADVQKVIQDLEPETVRYRSNECKKATDGIIKAWTDASRKITKPSADEIKLWAEKGKPFEEQWLSDLESKGIRDGRQILSDLKVLGSKVPR